MLRTDRITFFVHTINNNNNNNDGKYDDDNNKYSLHRESLSMYGLPIACSLT